MLTPPLFSSLITECLAIASGHYNEVSGQDEFLDVVGRTMMPMDKWLARVSTGELPMFCFRYLVLLLEFGLDW